MTLQKKVELLDMLREKKNFVAVARHYSINESTEKCMPLDGNIIREKARNPYQQFSKEGAEPQPGTSRNAEDFVASRGWFDRFQKRYNLRSASLYGEADPDKLKATVREKKYKPEQAFNMVETGIFWKKIPSKGIL
ncbi:hypothetical protein M514_05207 [Trichuris suis]|uniref:HTH CENPB-type domain-containing protein n=1 Tax=Trichuris suis TaxID=68888 RepID=A0A085M9P4_9BILA|nr:hypothetical protein M513_05207 [Trichuris suis]KFD60770.1 hypothetical protein M514_05207 [Trichuris suis]